MWPSVRRRVMALTTSATNTSQSAIMNRRTRNASAMSTLRPLTPLTETVRDFLDPNEFYALLRSAGLEFYVGVPDSLLKDFCACVEERSGLNEHIIAANEGAAVGVAAGYHLATGRIPVVYMQNSGIGNAINPLLSLADPLVYAIPMLLMVGWRGEPGKKDEPQHMVQGRVMASLLADLRIPFEVLPDFMEGASTAIDVALATIEQRPGPYAFLVKRQTFSPYVRETKLASNPELTMTREGAIEVLLDECSPRDMLVATTGFASRELYELRERRGEDHSHEFLTVGSMGHASAIALGLAIAQPSRRVICLDGDGACMMHLGTAATIAVQRPSNLVHILLNNGAHDSVGGQTTHALDIDIPGMARSLGYAPVSSASTRGELKAALHQINADITRTTPAFLEVRICRGARSDLGRPTTSPLENKTAFMQFVSD